MGLTLLQVIILAIVQGITEFLPVSSSGHLVIIAAMMSPTGTTEGLDITELSIILHAGTLLSIIVFYWSRIIRLLGEDRRVIGLLVVGTIPAVMLGLPLKKFGTHILENPLLAGCLLLLTGAILIWTSRQKVGEGTYREMNYGKTIGIGICQAFAILPGISRSGMTICSGLTMGLSRRDAATFAFLLALPAIGGATVLEIVDLVKESGTPTVAQAPAEPGTVRATAQAEAVEAEAVETEKTEAPRKRLPLSTLGIGFIISFIVGLVSLWWLVKWLESDRLHYCAWWVFPVGIGIIIWQVFYVLGN